MYTDKSFLATLKPYVIKDMQDSKILASLTAAQAFLESNKGNSGLAVQANNLFGIKGKYNGQSVKMWTTEYYNGVKQRVQADFRKYPSWQESVSDHSGMFNRMSRYANLRGETDYKKACRNVRLDGYATAPVNDYINSLINLIEKYKLYEWDNEVLGGKPVQTITGYQVGKTYTLQANMFVRQSPNGEKVKFDSFTEDAKKHGHFDEEGNGILDSGTRVTCKEIAYMGLQTWMRIPSGWVCAVGTKTFII